MNLKTHTAIVGVTLALFSGVALAQNNLPETFEPEAYAIVEAAYEFLGNQSRLSFTSTATYDVEYQDGIRAQYGMDQTVDLSRGVGF